MYRLQCVNAVANSSCKMNMSLHI